MFVITGAFLAIGVVPITSDVLLKERAQHFRSLIDISIATGMKIIKEPTLEDNTSFMRSMMSHNVASILPKAIQE